MLDPSLVNKKQWWFCFRSPFNYSGDPWWPFVNLAAPSSRIVPHDAQEAGYVFCQIFCRRKRHYFYSTLHCLFTMMVTKYLCYIFVGCHLKQAKPTETKLLLTCHTSFQMDMPCLHRLTMMLSSFLPHFSSDQTLGFPPH